MIQLNEKQYDMLLEPLAQADFSTLFARSVLAGHVDVKVFVDRMPNPLTFYIVHSYGLSMLFGNADNAQFNSDLLDYFAQIDKDEWLQAHPRAWDCIFEGQIAAGKAQRYHRLNFDFNRGIFEKNNPVALLDGYEIAPTTAAMFSTIQGLVTPSAFWRDKQGFLANTSFTVMVDGKPASTAFAAYRHDNILELGIETAEKHRGRGLARVACARLIHHCIESGLEPAWTCRLENTASTNLAEKLGFREIRRLPFYNVIGGGR